MESFQLEECSRTLTQEQQELAVVYVAIAIEVGLIYHFLNIYLVYVDCVLMHKMLDIRFVQLAILVGIHFVELFSQKFLVFADRTI